MLCEGIQVQRMLPARALAYFLAMLSLGSNTMAKSQTLKGVKSGSSVELRLPALTITGVTMNTTSDGALIQTTMGLTRQQIEINNLTNKKTIIDTYAGTSVRSTTLFDPQTFSAGTPASKTPNNCGALTRNDPASGSSSPATYTYPTVAGTLPAQNPLGGDYWLGTGSDTGTVTEAQRSLPAGTGLGITAYICPIVP